MSEVIGEHDKDSLDLLCRAFLGLTDGRMPFPWQRRVFQRLAQGRISATVGLPTGTGKTSLIPVSLIALAWQTIRGQVSLPRRLIWVVNRRVVVDQASDEASGLNYRRSHTN